MDDLKCFSDVKNPNDLDFNSFEFSHNLSTHSSFEIDNIKKLISEIPRYKVVISSDKAELKTDFETILSCNKGEMDLESVFENIKTSQSYIAISGFENHKLFKKIHNDIVHDIKIMLKNSKRNELVTGATFWMFIASPNIVTPFHFDRFSNFIMQIKGQKTLAVFPHFRVTSSLKLSVKSIVMAKKLNLYGEMNLIKKAKSITLSRDKRFIFPIIPVIM